MTKQEFLEYCSGTYVTSADYPFEGDFETAVLRHTDNKKWYAIAMRVSKRKFSEDSDEIVDVVNLKVPLDLYGEFDAFDGVFPAYHMNKRHWISVILQDVSDDLLRHLVDLSYDATKQEKKRIKQEKGAK
jgi:predicted DNA-binding protein (MmcQ/YjbR family)